MKAQFTFLSGARAGQIDLLGKSYITVGRHPASHLRCDAEQDLDVSARHATIAFESGFFILRDLDSTNGTFVNGTRLSAEHLLANDDVLQLGTKGPRIQFRMVRGSEPEVQSGTNVYRPSADSEGGGSRAVPPGQALSEAELKALRTTSGNPYPEQARARPDPIRRSGSGSRSRGRPATCAARCTAWALWSSSWQGPRSGSGTRACARWTGNAGSCWARWTAS